MVGSTDGNGSAFEEHRRVLRGPVFLRAKKGRKWTFDDMTNPIDHLSAGPGRFPGSFLQKLRNPETIRDIICHRRLRPSVSFASIDPPRRSDATERGLEGLELQGGRGAQGRSPPESVNLSRCVVSLFLLGCSGGCTSWKRHVLETTRVNSKGVGTS